MPRPFWLTVASPGHTLRPSREVRMKHGPSNSILDAIGGTPLIAGAGGYSQMEYLNPSGSVKARIAKYMIERAEDEGLLRHGDTIVEATSGNTGNALSMVASSEERR